MPAAHAGVDEGGERAAGGGLRGAWGGQGAELGAHLGGLFGLGQVVAPAHPLCQLLFLFDALRLAQPIPHPGQLPIDKDPPQRIFDHIPHDPIRGKELGGGGDLFLCDLDVLFQVGKHLVFRLGVVVLVEPADDLHLLFPVAFRDVVHHPLDHRAVSQNMVRKEQLGVILDFLEHPGQDRAEGVALGDEQVLVQPVLVVCLLEGDHPVLIEAGQLQVQRLGQDLRLEAARLVGKHPHMAGQIPVYL